MVDCTVQTECFLPGYDIQGLNIIGKKTRFVWRTSFVNKILISDSATNIASPGDCSCHCTKKREKNFLSQKYFLNFRSRKCYEYF